MLRRIMRETSDGFRIAVATESSERLVFTAEW